ncbi:nucleotidyl transferase AbiEii/AbiGii toxin family protein [Sphingobacterium mizutaii]|uniref:nucleotidyl transferase AbiEii/AbiGii toxin family protein n=1 Tax=Sphingobacterium mizutaii TaxID=1010 RepID=UPI00162851FB|nr:nucleotidyl transferase AbiEii/AbiGii toxin family protein [Sphingobacterium mizutaii]MBV2227575.1 nucleotidyl transferase AbiEii/AbiGii toxin family protein [Sphingobacterium mizutaii]
MIKEWLASYEPKNQEQAFSALREIMQEVALAGLQRSGFFEKAAFYGGTALRIFYGLDRFSEDLDFSLLSSDPEFSLEPYFKGLVEEFANVGLQVSIKEKKKTKGTSIDSAFLKPETVWRELILEGMVLEAGLSAMVGLKIKLEVDRQPPLRFETEEKLLIKPFSFYVKCFTKSNLFAGKMHALLFRKWKNRVKGRDWYDLEWYIRKGVPLNLDHFLARAQDTGNWTNSTIEKEELLDLLKKRIDSVSMEAVKEDIVKFIPDNKKLDIWSKKYFLELIEQLKFE